MRRASRLLAIAATCSCLITASRAQHAKFVDPFLGVDGGGNVFPGATLPFGMLKAGPDTGDNTANSGWSNEPINGFSQTHVSGTGGGAKYGNILLQPTTGDISPDDHASGRLNERASPGFYGVSLSRYNISVEIASARRSAIYRFTYPSGAAANLLIDAGHCLASAVAYGEGQVLRASSVEVLSPTEIAGSTSVTGGWNKQPSAYTVFFYAVTDKPAEKSGTWRDGKLQRGAQKQAEEDGSKTGAWVTFSSRGRHTVLVKIGISFLSIDQAKRNAQTEIASFDFKRTSTLARAAWDKALAPVSIDAGDDDRRQFYTALYHTMLMPTDRTGENPLFQSNEPSYDDFFAIWDTFRSSTPLLTLIAEKNESGIVRSLVDLYRHEGWLPDARSGNYNGRVQGGSDADMTIADGYLKHLPDVDWETAWKAVVNDAEQSPKDPDKEGRGDLKDWHDHGYLTIEGTDRPASKHMEYAANDYAIALMARGMGNVADDHKYSQRAANWKNLWDTDAADHGFQGFIWPRHRDGTWAIDFKPFASGSWGSDNFYEGNSWTYSTFVPQDVAGLIEASGGNKRFVERMDVFFALPKGYDVTNEPGFLAPYLYLWAARPDRTQSQIRSILIKSYHAGRNGLPGNDDSGAMSSWYAFAKMGFYPNAAQDVYLIGSPAYRRTRLTLPNGRLFDIETENNGPDKPYIAGVLWNGAPYRKAWFTHEQLMQGGVLRIKMSATPTDWGVDDPPPSMSKTN